MNLELNTSSNNHNKLKHSLYMQNIILRLLWCRFLSSRHVTGIKLLQDGDQPNDVVGSQAGDCQQPDGGEPIQSYEVDEDVDDAHNDVEDADGKGGEKAKSLVLGEAIKNPGEADNVEDTPDDRPDPVAGGVGSSQEGAQDIDDPDQDEADANIPEEKDMQTHLLYVQLYTVPHTIDNVHTETELLKARNLAAKSCNGELHHSAVFTQEGIF